MSRLTQSHTLSARRNRRRALLALLVAVAISAQPATTVLATSDKVKINNGQSVTVDDDIICEGETLRAILAEEAA